MMVLRASGQVQPAEGQHFIQPLRRIALVHDLAGLVT